VSQSDDSYRAARLAITGAVALYGLGFMLWYGGTPLGRAPVLDGREILDLARQIADGTLAHEPFYRAPLYSALLAVPLGLGLDPAWLPAFARTLNFLAHLGSACAVAGITLRLGGSRYSALGAFALWGIYPVALHLAGDPLDITLGIALLLGGIYFALGIAREAPAPSNAGALAALAGGALALASLARPNFLGLLLVAAAVALLLAVREAKLRRPVLVGVATALALLIGFGLSNWAWSGRFWLTPWQGAYNLWAANRPESNGRYYQQLIEIRNVDRHVNPARLESEELYRRETGAVGALDPAATSAFWSAKLVAHVVAHPLGWARLLALRAAYLFHNDEQYDNKTYAFQKRESPWLRYNALGFGLLLVLAGACAALRGRQGRVRWYLVLVGAYAASALLVFASDRFRLPLAALLVPLAALAAETLWAARRDRAALAGAAATAAVAAAVAFWPHSRADAEATYTEDLLLGAQAAADVGQYRQSEELARRALEREPGRSFGWEQICAARYNALLSGLPLLGTPIELDRDSAQACLNPAARSDQAHALGAVFLWRLGKHSDAVAIWHDLAQRDSPAQQDALAYLLLVGADLGKGGSATGDHPPSALLLLVLAARGDGMSAALLAPSTDLDRERQRLKALLPIPSSP
jgi:4-amino-4-deoxy-L-arabinose transferase-like glycosyltransferase